MAKWTIYKCYQCSAEWGTPLQYDACYLCASVIAVLKSESFKPRKFGSTATDEFEQQEQLSLKWLTRA